MIELPREDVATVKAEGSEAASIPRSDDAATDPSCTGATDPPKKRRSEAEKKLAETRSHEDVKLANGLFQAAGQSFTLINGGAATATLTFASAKSDLGQKSFNPDVLSFSILMFASGVLAGSLTIIFQAISVRYYAVKWTNIAIGKKEHRIESAKRRGDLYGMLPPICTFIAALCFAYGALLLAASQSEAVRARLSWLVVLP